MNFDEHHKDQPKFQRQIPNLGLMTKHQDNLTFTKIGLPNDGPFTTRKSSWATPTCENRSWIRIQSEGCFQFKGIKLTTQIPCSLVWIWCEQT
jgi:hypothetical protein